MHSAETWFSSSCTFLSRELFRNARKRLELGVGAIPVCSFSYSHQAFLRRQPCGWLRVVSGVCGIIDGIGKAGSRFELGVGLSGIELSSDDFTSHNQLVTVCLLCGVSTSCHFPEGVPLTKPPFMND